MNKHRYHTIAIVAAMLIPATLHAAYSNAERIALLQSLLDYNVPFSTEVPIDSIIKWEKILEPELEQQQQYSLLFQLKHLTVQALITKGNISLAIDKANLMYQKAKDMNYAPGTALSLQAIGNTYQSSSAAIAAIESYEEALEAARKIPNATPYTKTILSQLILTKLKYRQLTNIGNYIRQLKSLSDKSKNHQDAFYLAYCQAFYNIQTRHLPEALTYLQQADSINQHSANSYYLLMTKYLYSRYYTESEDYIQALKIFDETPLHISTAASYNSIPIQQERAQILALMGKNEEACETYESLNAIKDSLETLNYIRQINELHTLYQIDKKELDSLNRQKTILYWSWFTILSIVTLIIFFIFLIKRSNKRLRQSQLKLGKAQKQEENSIRTKSLFLSNMSHEIRTPLNALSGFSSILTEESIDNETRQQCSDIIQQNSELLLKLINDVIDLSRLEAQMMKFQLQDYDIIELCKEVCYMAHIKNEQTGIKVQFSADTDSQIIRTDTARLAQALLSTLVYPQGKEQQQERIIRFTVSRSGNMIHFRISNSPLAERAFVSQETIIRHDINRLLLKHFGGDYLADNKTSEEPEIVFIYPITSESK